MNAFRKKFYQYFGWLIPPPPTRWDSNHTLFPPYYIPTSKIRECWEQNVRWIHAWGVAMTVYTKIGKKVTIFHEVNLAIHHEMGPTIGDECILFPKCSVIGNVTLGHHCIVGNSAVVTKSFPPYSLIAGNPARLIRTMSEEEFEKEKGYFWDALYWQENLTKNRSMRKPFKRILKRQFQRHDRQLKKNS